MNGNLHLKTLQDAFAYFSDRQNCVDYVVKMRWPDGKVSCPTCGSEAVTWLPTRFLFQCKGKHKKLNRKFLVMFEEDNQRHLYQRHAATP